MRSSENEVAAATEQKSYSRRLIVLSCLLVLVIVVSAMIGAYARYVTKANGSASARVAKYDMTVNNQISFTGSIGGGTANNFVPGGESGGRTIELTYNGEVAVEYVIQIKTQENLHIEFNLYRVDTSTNEETLIKSNLPVNDEMGFVFDRIEPGSSTRRYYLKAKLKSTSIEDANKVELIEVIVTARQVD